MLKAKSYQLKARKGYTVLLTVLVVGAVAVVIATALLVVGVDSARDISEKESSRGARAMAHACAEEALEQIRDASNFTGYGTLTLGSNTCGYNVVNLGGTNRSIAASSTVNSAVRKVALTLDKVKPINITSWQEVIDF